MRIPVRGLILAFGIIVADQLSKFWVTTRYLAEGDASVDFLSWLFKAGEQFSLMGKTLASFLNIVLVWNPGVSFGMLQTGKSAVTLALTVLAVLVAIGFIVWLFRDPKPVRAWSIGLIVGGALGNVWDRLRFGAVIDFIDIHAGDWHWPAFNLADSAITIGVVIILIETFFFSSHSVSRRDA